MRVYITKHALSKGIIEAEVEQVAPAVVRHEDGSKVNTYYAGEWCTTPEQAVAIAEQMRAKKIKNHRRFIELLEGISFDPGNVKTPEYHYNRNTPVIQYKPEGSVEYKSVIDAVNKTGFQANGISKCCRGERDQYKGYVWKYKDKEK